jgi:hypothetical protein
LAEKIEGKEEKEKEDERRNLYKCTVQIKHKKVETSTCAIQAAA